MENLLESCEIVKCMAKVYRKYLVKAYNVLKYEVNGTRDNAQLFQYFPEISEQRMICNHGAFCSQF